jgi:Zn-dependent M32 family carboxypeptidase
MSKRKAEPTYTSDDMLEIINLFATHVVLRYELHSKAIRLKMDIAPEALVAIWQQEMELAAGKPADNN